MIHFHTIPGTNLEIASRGNSSARIIYIRRTGELEPIDQVDGARVVLIGSVHRELRQHMKDGTISRNTLTEAGIEPMSGNAYHQMRAHLNKSQGRTTQ